MHISVTQKLIIQTHIQINSVSLIFIAMKIILTQTKTKSLFWLTVAEGAVHHDNDTMQAGTEGNWSHYVHGLEAK